MLNIKVSKVSGYIYIGFYINPIYNNNIFESLGTVEYTQNIFKIFSYYMNSVCEGVIY